MISFRNERQHVMPRWLTYRDAVASGELDSSGKGSRRLITDTTLESDWLVFQQTKAPLLAADLLGRARAAGQNERAKQIASFIIETGSCQPLTQKLAEKILGQDSFLTLEEDVYIKIHRLKKYLREAPRNPGGWIDLARLYTVLHQDDHAEDSIRVALALAPVDRFCLRAAARFYIHTDNCEAADRLFRRHSDRLHDPWVHATAASVACWASKPSLLPSKGGRKWAIEHSSLQRSELLEAIGMEEFMSGSDRIAKKAIRAALEFPTSNTVAHAEWITRTFLSGLRSAVLAHHSLSKPALSHTLFEEGKIREAELAAEQWVLEEPYSSAPLVQISFLASIQQNYERVVECCQRALKARLLHPMLINNTAFALLQLGELEEATLLLARIPESEKSKSYAFIATEGLLHIKRGDAETGRQYYDSAFNLAVSIEPSAKNRVRLHKFLALTQKGEDLTKDELSQLREIAAGATATSERILLERITRSAQANDKEPLKAQMDTLIATEAS